MYTNFNDLHKAYGLDNPNKTRDCLSYEEKKAFVEDCFNTYEHIGFADTFISPYTGTNEYNGMKFSVIGRVREIDGADIECLPIWKIKFENGDTVQAYPEEICIAERNHKIRI